MKKTVLLTALIVTIFSAAAYTGYTGPKDQPHVLGATGSSSASQSITENGSDWSMTFTQYSAGPSNVSTGVLNSSFENNTVSFQGIVQVPTPCYSLEAGVKERENDSYLFNVTSHRVDGKEACPQVISYRKYNATFSAEEPFELEVTHKGESIRNLTHPQYGEDEAEKNGGVLAALMNFFSNLF